MNQNGKWVVGGLAERPTRAAFPSAEYGGPKVFVVRYVERGNLLPSPLWGRLTVRHAVGGMG